MALYYHLKQIIRIFLVFVILCCAHGFAFATESQTNEQWYQVEMIIFSQIPDGELQDEMWPQIRAFTPPMRVFSLVPMQIYQAQTLTNYPLLLPTDFLLSKPAEHLMNNPHYHLVGHLSWLQPIGSSDRAPTYIQAANNQSAVDALVQLKQNRFIQLSIQAVIAINDSDLTTSLKQLKDIDTNAQIRFALHQSIRMKTQELNYIDSPYFGILLEIVPHSAPEKMPLQTVASTTQNLPLDLAKH